MLGIVVVPRNTVVGQKREKLVSVFLKPISPFSGDFGVIRDLRHLPVEATNASHMFAEEPALQAPVTQWFVRYFSEGQQNPPQFA